MPSNPSSDVLEEEVGEGGGEGWEEEGFVLFTFAFIGRFTVMSD